jgi:hypothetical protein
MSKRYRGATRSSERRERWREELWLRRYGYVHEWQLALWRFKRRRELAVKGEP